MASASTTIRGPVLGSVPEPVKMPPIHPCATTHMAKASTAASGEEDSRTTGEQRAETDDQRHDGQQPAPCVADRDSRAPKLLRKWSNQLGFPDAMSVIIPEMEPLARFWEAGTRPRPATSTRPDHEWRDRAAQCPSAAGRRVHAHRRVVAAIGRPCHQPDQAVDEDRARCAAQRACGSGQDHAQSLAEHPDAKGPGERQAECGSDGPVETTGRRRSPPGSMRRTCSTVRCGAQ